MIRKYSIVTVFFIAFLLFGSTVYSESFDQVDSAEYQCCQDINNLNLRIDSLEARMESLQIQIVESNPLKSAKYLLWGKGLSFFLAKSEPRISCDIGYTFLTQKSFRMGIAAGFDGEFGPESELPTYGFYGKVTYGTPVFINFISVNVYARTIYYPKDALLDDQTSGGIGAGAELEFWFAPVCCYTLGGSMTLIRKRSMFNSVKIGEVNFVGFKFFPKFIKKKG